MRQIVKSATRLSKASQVARRSLPTRTRRRKKARARNFARAERGQQRGVHLAVDQRESRAVAETLPGAPARPWTHRSRARTSIRRRTSGRSPRRTARPTSSPPRQVSKLCAYPARCRARYAARISVAQPGVPRGPRSPPALPRTRYRCATRSPCCAGSSQRARHLQLGAVEHHARVGRPPEQRLALRVPREDAVAVGVEQALERQVAARAEQAVGFLKAPAPPAGKRRLPSSDPESSASTSLAGGSSCRASLHDARPATGARGVPPCSSARRNSNLAKNSLNISPPSVPTAYSASAAASCSSRIAASGCGAGPASTRPPSAGSYWLCSEQQWITDACLLRALLLGAVADEADVAVG